jgi:hypothetical protein
VGAGVQERAAFFGGFAWIERLALEKSKSLQTPEQSTLVVNIPFEPLASL